MKVARLIGGAGTGKTSTLLEIMESALEKLGHDPLRLGFASFTRAARAEAVDRASKAWGVPPELLAKKGWFRTVHSAAYRCIEAKGQQVITDSQTDLEWLSNALGVGLTTEIDDETGAVRYVGDVSVATALNAWSIARSSLIPLEEVIRRMRRVDDTIPGMTETLRFVERYETAKRLDDRIDYTDMLMKFAGVGFSPTEGEYACQPIGALPEVSAWLFDEQQDASPLLDRCCKRLVSAPSVQWCYVVGDPFQAIYGFAGSSADCFMAWPAEKERIMPKSWRCPKAVLELGERCLRRMFKGYFDRGIAPADHAGTVNEITSIDDLVNMVDPSGDWLLIARTNFQATRLFAAMMQAGKPARWTTSPQGITNRHAGLTALYALERGEAVSGVQWSKALELLPQKEKAGNAVVARGTKAKWKKAEEAEQWDLIFPNELEKVGATEFLVGAIRTGDWVGLVDNGRAWRESAMRHGVELSCEPKVRVGTIHSVKGAEAENVAFLTTTSQRVQVGSEDAAQHDEECRIAYVGVTRAKKNLYVINEGKRSATPRMEVL
jgi:DNA helicase-2/ATP-dependent DNA helicase PcrA